MTRSAIDALAAGIVPLAALGAMLVVADWMAERMER
jgi:hypothetical protein